MIDSEVGYETLMRQAPMTAEVYLAEAIESIEKRMGEGAAEKFPQIVAALITAAATDYHAAMFSHRVAPALLEIGDSIRMSGDLFRAVGESIETAGQSIADGLSE